jgi:signal transduction histidine kinase
MSAPALPGRGFLRRVRDFLQSRVTWKAVGLYHIDMLAGLVVPVVVIAVGATAVALLLSPLIAWADITSFQAGDPNAAFGLSAAVQWLGFAMPATAVQVTSVLLGLLLAAVVLHAAEGAVRVHGSLVTNLTGISLSSLELAAARTEAATQQARAERSEQSRRELIVNASHELRTPIASIRGHVDALLDPAGRPTKADQRRYLEIVQRETERLSALVDDLLAVARADSGELKLDVRPTNVRAVAEHVASALAPIAERDRKVTLVTRFDDALPEAMADGDRLGQVLMNLVRNAIMYTPEGGLVAVEASHDGPGHIEVGVEDTGVGIPPEDLERIFDRFYRTDSSRSRATGGFGLGLSISRDLVQAMGGSIEVTSEPGTGSRFVVKLRRVV